MAVWELVRDAADQLRRAGEEWMTTGEIAAAAAELDPSVNLGTVRNQVRFHCINDRTKQYEPSQPYKRRPLFVTDDPTMHGKRYRFLTDAEKTTFLSNIRDDLETVSYAQFLDWLDQPTKDLVPQSPGDAEDLLDERDELTGLALLEIHLQDYLHRNWKTVFPELVLYQGNTGREFRTSDPSVGILDFLCQDSQGTFVVVETKKDMADRKAIGQILAYMGWVQEKLCSGNQQVRGILIASQGSDQLRYGVKAVPNLQLIHYEIGFKLTPAD